MTQRTIETSDGTTLAVDMRGPDKGEAIVFAHEFGGDMGTWDGVFAVLSSEFRCIRYAARGVHPSAVPSEMSRYGQAPATQDVLDLAKALELDRFHLVGCSMGSFTSLMTAIEVPEMIRSLTLIGCSTGPRDDQERRTYRDALTKEIALLDSKSAAGAVEWFANDPAYDRMGIKQPAHWRTYLDRLERQSVEGARQILKTVHWNRVALPTLRGAIQNISAPALVLYGEEDHPLVLETAPFLQDCLANGTTLPMPGTGHLVHLEEPKLFLGAFLKLARSAAG